MPPRRLAAARALLTIAPLPSHRIPPRPTRRLAAAVALLADRAHALPADARKQPFPYRETFHDNGLRVLSLEDPGSGVVAVHLWYHVGAKDEQPGRQGF